MSVFVEDKTVSATWARRSLAEANWDEAWACRCASLASFSSVCTLSSNLLTLASATAALASVAK